jgi:ABC-type lipoprotein export system ATPase subunit
VSPLLHVNHLTKSFKVENTEKEVLKGIDFSLNESSILSIMGPSGGGKSTFLKILAGIIYPAKGDILFKGESIQKLGSQYTSQISFIFQDYKLIPHLTVFENVALALRLKGIEGWRERALDALEYMQILHLKESTPLLLSGGESQRVGIARAICVRPSIIFADEPTGNLDRKTGHDIIRVFHDIKKQFNTSFVVVTHDFQMKEYSDETRYLIGGFLLEKDPYEND